MVTKVTRDETAAGAGEPPENSESIWEDRYFSRLDAELSGIRSDVQHVDGKIDRVEEKLSDDIQRLDGKLDSHFRWTIGFFLAVMVALVAKNLGH